MMVLLVLALLVLPSPAAAHLWFSPECCSAADCRPTAFGEVERRPDGWFVASTNELIPFDDAVRLRRSLDPLIYVCTPFKRVRCLYIPEVAG
jgi:hypothetical protein